MAGMETTAGAERDARESSIASVNMAKNTARPTRKSLTITHTRRSFGEGFIFSILKSPTLEERLATDIHHVFAAGV
jgi:hypothetical protein